MTSANGSIEQEELGILLASLHEDEKLLDQAMAYGRATTLDEFIEASAGLLNADKNIVSCQIFQMRCCMMVGLPHKKKRCLKNFFKVGESAVKALNQS